jgi:hypothetical protein
MDRKKYISEIMDKSGIRIDEDDPMFTVVLMNQMLFSEQKTELETMIQQLVSLSGQVAPEVIRQVEHEANQVLKRSKSDLNALSNTLQNNIQTDHIAWRTASKEILSELSANRESKKSFDILPLIAVSLVTGISTALVILFMLSQ